jgi:hypothetical protein
MSDRAMRTAMTAVAVGQVVFAGGFVLQVPAFTSLWPFEGTTPLSHALIGSFFLAAAASTGWCLWVRSDRGFTGIALDYLAILVPFTLVSAGRVVDGAGIPVLLFGVACAAGAVFGLVLVRWSRSHAWRDPLPMPRLVRGAFVAFAAVLVVVAVLLVVQVPNVMPWTITPELSTLFGLLFLGAASYFAYGLTDARWENAGGQLAGFLAYDLVLIIPLLQRFPTVSDQLRPSLWIYTLVVVVSGIVAVWYLFVDARTRLRPGRSVRAQLVVSDPA